MTAFPRQSRPAESREGLAFLSRLLPTARSLWAGHESTDATVRHELGLGDLSGIESEVTLEQYGPTTRRTIESILVPVAGGPHSDVAVRLAANIAESWDAAVQLLTVLAPSADDRERSDAEARLRTYAETVEVVPVETRVETRDDVVSALADLTRRHELVVIGASEGSLFRRFFRGTIPSRLGSASGAPIFVVKSR